MKRILFSVLFAASLSAEAQTQTFETAFARPLNEVLTDIQNRFGIRLCIREEYTTWKFSPAFP